VLLSVKLQVMSLLSVKKLLHAYKLSYGGKDYSRQYMIIFHLRKFRYNKLYTKTKTFTRQ